MLRHYAVLETKDTKVEHCCTQPSREGMNHHSKKVTMIPKTPQLTGHFFTLMDGARKIRSKKIIINRKKIPSAESEWERDVFTKLIHRENWLWAQKILPTPPKVTSIKIEAAGMSWVRLQTHTSACDVTAPLQRKAAVYGYLNTADIAMGIDEPSQSHGASRASLWKQTYTHPYAIEAHASPCHSDQSNTCVYSAKMASLEEHQFWDSTSSGR